MNIFLSAILMLHMTSSLVNAFNCGDKIPQNVCLMVDPIMGQVWFARADDIPPSGAGKGCKLAGTHVKDARGCCPLATIKPGRSITMGEYHRAGCGPSIPDPPPPKMA
ncbi:hypothetical protein PGT21_007842 [Puccinia graminis f. sp. tritici]|uniref:Uncharacterized protein n=1 Tax=Puccinia graminis f. sp. tritici TaxID=56615 RepID=A0A5B0LHW1_PUCGR|nr:hypothetical protein PGTUg99_006185 [Puccinia graminis f. sp. tritici]KAA1065694.1 hypothetical protein PGT21_007842 [Puccinia graminis f. sp. tritici]